MQQNCELKISFLEIYNDNLTDLLKEADQKDAGLKVKEDKDGFIYVDDLVEQVICSKEEVATVYLEALAKRKAYETIKNELSSRSHAVFQIMLYSKEDLESTSYFGGSSYSQMNLKKAPRNRKVRLAQFTFVDLAGSEKIDEEKDQDRINEAKYINKSLSALGNVI